MRWQKHRINGRAAPTFEGDVERSESAAEALLSKEKQATGK